MIDMTTDCAALLLRKAAGMLEPENTIVNALLMGAEALEATIPGQPSIPCPVCGREIVIAEHPKISASAPES